MSAVSNPQTDAPPPAAPDAAASPPLPAFDPHPHHGHRSLRWSHKVVLFLYPALATLAIWGAGVKGYQYLNPPKPDATLAAAVPSASGAALFGQNCASCHGVRGDGNGVTRIDPRARYFGAEKFKLVTTTNPYSPTDDDLYRVIRRGIPGTAMHGFDHLPDADVRAIIGHVRQLTKGGIYTRLWAKAQKEFDDGNADEPPNPAKIAALAAKDAVPGKPLDIPAHFATPTTESLARGKQVFLKTCANCHGPEGRGDGQQVKDPSFKNEDGTPARPRDLTRGVFKGGGQPEHIYARVMLGIPGTPMPQSMGTLPPADVLDLVGYVTSLSPPSTSGAAVVAAAGGP